MSGFMDCSGISDIGRIRETNEDHFLIADVCRSMRVHQTSLGFEQQTRLFGNTQGKLIVVADGMGGHASGERASQLVIDTVVDYALNRLSWFLQSDAETEEDFIDQLKGALVSCQNRIDKEVAAIPQRNGMGSTLTMAYLAWPRLFLIHVGDCRLYLFRNRELDQLTRDHTLAELASRISVEDSQSKTPETEKRKKGMSNVLWNVIGGGSGTPHPDALSMNLEIGDILLMCTDGMWQDVSEKKIQEILEQSVSSATMCQQLIDAANAVSGSDNITVVVSRFLKEIPQTQVIQELEEPQPDMKDTADFVESEKISVGSVAV